MSRPRIVVRHFGTGIWPRLVDVLASTLRRQCPGWDHDVERIDPEPLTSSLGVHGAVTNTQKLDAWCAAVTEARIGDRLLLLDADTVVVRPIEDVWDRSFDLAYTVKPKESRFPFNGGVMFLRVSSAVQAFIAAWRDENRRMFDDPKHHQVWRPCFGGINQSALGALFHQHRATGLEVQRLPCLEWNCEDESWANFDADVTRIVHIKGALQRALFGRGPSDRDVRPLMERWLELEAHAKEIQMAPEHAQKPVPLPPDDRSPSPTGRAVIPSDLDDQMVRPTDLENREDEPEIPREGVLPVTTVKGIVRATREAQRRSRRRAKLPEPEIEARP